MYCFSDFDILVLVSGVSDAYKIHKGRTSNANAPVNIEKTCNHENGCL